MRASNVIYEVEEGRSFIKLRPLQMLVTLVLVLLLTLVLVSLVLTGPVAHAVGSAVGLGGTAVTVVADALDRLRTTASAHHRVVVVEAMGRDTGWVAAYGGLAGGADLIIVPEIQITSEQVVRTMKRHRAIDRKSVV